MNKKEFILAYKNLLKVLRSYSTELWVCCKDSNTNIQTFSTQVNQKPCASCRRLLHLKSFSVQCSKNSLQYWRRKDLRDQAQKPQDREPQPTHWTAQWTTRRIKPEEDLTTDPVSVANIDDYNYFKRRLHNISPTTMRHSLQRRSLLELTILLKTRRNNVLYNLVHVNVITELCPLTWFSDHLDCTCSGLIHYVNCCDLRSCLINTFY